MTEAAARIDVGDALLAAARAGDDDAFRRLTMPFYRALHVHCYRMLGSLEDADDVVQETLFHAWRGLRGYEGRAPFRSWLYRIATNACLDALERRGRRVLPNALGPADDPRRPAELPAAEVSWLEPYPDAVLHDPDGDPEALYGRRESLRLAFVAAIQYLPPRQRAALILRDALDWKPSEVAQLLGCSVAAVNSALQRARSTLATRFPNGRLDAELAASAEVEASVVERYLDAWDAADADRLAALLCEEATMTMPPTPSWYAGREAIRTFFAQLFAGEWGGRLFLDPIRANGQPALAVYERDAEVEVARPFAIKVLTISGELVAEITGFSQPAVLGRFGLRPRYAGARRAERAAIHSSWGGTSSPTT